VEEFLLRLRYWRFEKRGLNIPKRRRIVAKLGTSLVCGKAQLFAE